MEEIYAREITTKKLQRGMKKEELRRGRTHKANGDGGGVTASLQ
jgi:hypothetical protein